MKSQTKNLAGLLPAALILVFLISACNGNKNDQSKKLQDENDQLKLMNDSLSGIIANFGKGYENKPACLEEVDEKTALKMAGDFKPSGKSKDNLRGAMLYYKHAKYLSNRFKSHIHATYAAKDKGMTVYIIAVHDKDRKWHYFVADSKCMENPPPDMTMEPSDTDTTSGPLPCPPCVNCPPCPLGPCSCCGCA